MSIDPLRRWASLCLDALDALLFPPECAVCGTGDTDTPFCPACRDELTEAAGSACVRCAMPLGLVAAQQAARRGGCADCLGRSLGFDEAIALGPYQGPLRVACLRLKHARDAWLARWLADLLIDVRGESIRAFASRSERPPLVVPIPLHWWRRQRRRYNQAEELASRLAHRLGLRRVRPLRRAKATAPLAGRGRVERAEALRGAFGVRRNAPDLDGRDLILVDDILTTGATCGAAARALKARGAARVLALVIGRAEGRT